jgi:twitching motility protein PilI
MAKKFNLREFQSELSRQIQAAATRDNSASRLGFRAGSINWIVPLADTEEVIPVPVVVPVPGSRRWFRGVANIRGNLYAVSDLADFLGQGATPDHADCRLVIPHHDFGINAALLVRSTLGLKNIGQFSVLPEEGALAWAARRYLDDSGAEWQELDFSRLLNNDAFMQVEAQLNS